MKARNLEMLNNNKWLQQVMLWYLISGLRIIHLVLILYSTCFLSYTLSFPQEINFFLQNLGNTPAVCVKNCGLCRLICFAQWEQTLLAKNHHNLLLPHHITWFGFLADILLWQFSIFKTLIRMLNFKKIKHKLLSQ